MSQIFFRGAGERSQKKMLFNRGNDINFLSKTLWNTELNSDK